MIKQAYEAGRRAALAKFAGTRVHVSHEGEADNQTHQRQAQSREDLPHTGPGVSTVWDRFDDKIQNPALVSEQVRFSW